MDDVQKIEVRDAKYYRKKGLWYRDRGDLPGGDFAFKNERLTNALDEIILLKTVISGSVTKSLADALAEIALLQAEIIARGEALQATRTWAEYIVLATDRTRYRRDHPPSIDEIVASVDS